MKIYKIIMISIIFMICFTVISVVSAQNISDLNVTDDLNDVIDNNISANDETIELLSDDSGCCEDENKSRTWYVEPDSENPNQVQKPTVQPIIDNAKDGDTIILNGTFVHCHFMINKTLTIIAAPGTSVGVCPHHTHAMKYGEGPETNGVFYISPKANGTVLKGFSFTNDFYYIANKVFNPFGVFVDADDVVLENLIFNWVGVENEGSKYDPKEFLFNAIILNNTYNTTINQVLLGNLRSFITSINSSNINANNISVIEYKIKEVLNSSVSSSNLKIFVGDNGKLQFTLKDEKNNIIANKTLIIVIDGESKSVSTDSNGTAILPVKFSSAGTYYATAIFTGDDDYKASFKTSKIIVAKKTTSISAPTVTLKIKKVKRISITLKSNGKLISGKKITIKVNGKTFSAKTNSKGVAKINVKVVKKGTYKCTVKFDGDNVYKSISKTGKIIVKK